MSFKNNKETNKHKAVSLGAMDVYFVGSKKRSPKGWVGYSESDPDELSPEEEEACFFFASRTIWSMKRELVVDEFDVGTSESLDVS